MPLSLAFIGMGEAGSAIVGGWGESRRGTIRAYDIKTDSPATADQMRARYAEQCILGCGNAAEAIADAHLVLCTVTADQAVAAARAAAPHLKPNAIWCDLNSCAPSSKREAAAIIEGDGGGRYVDVAVMAPVHPKRNMVPLLISGPYAEEAAPILAGLPMSPRVVEGGVGAASTIKMIRSIMVKGLEAVTAECLLAAVAAGVENEVLDSLLQSHSGSDWRAKAAYNLERMIAHGTRRAAEMEEVAKTVADLGLPDDMARATVLWQRRIGEAGAPATGDLESQSAKTLAEQLLPRLRRWPRDDPARLPGRIAPPIRAC
jgi:3-hydroxyisobutyrate dehydrogenase-like beta-hydroxyacid dehydrogenase